MKRVIAAALVMALVVLLICFVWKRRTVVRYAKNYPTLQACIDDVATQPKGGTRVVDDAWTAKGGANSDIGWLIPAPNVVILDKRKGNKMYWSARP